MDHSKFVPTLADLIKVDKDWGNQCYWQKKSKDDEVPVRCRNTIKAVDIQGRNRLIVNIRTLIGTYLERRELARPMSNIVSKIYDELERASIWFLCASQHRIYSSEIVQMWRDELDKFGGTDDLEDRKESKGQPAKSSFREETINPKNAIPAREINVRTELDIRHGDKIFCQGKNRDGTNCGRLIGAEKSRQAVEIIGNLSKSQDTSQDIKDNLSLLAKLLLCRRSHENQAADKTEEWLRKLSHVLQQSNATQQPVQTPKSSSTPQVPSTPAPRRAKTESLTPESIVSSVFSEADSIPYESPPTTRPRSRRDNTGTENVNSPSPSLRLPRKAAPPSTQTETDPVGRITRSSTFSLPPVDAVAKFAPYSPKSREAIRTKIYEKIKRTIIPREKPSGYIYGFRREGDKHIKIGYTNNIGRRINSWNTKCREKVEVVVKEYLPHAAKVESLVHAILHKQRRREVLIGGRCNGGKGCATAHEEWFDIAVDPLKEIVSLCKRWINAEPYDPVGGVLTPLWATYLDKLYFTRSSRRQDEWRDWLDVAKATATSVVVPSKVEERAAASITQTEIKSEEDATPVANVADQLRNLSRIYTKAVEELKTEAPKDTPLNGYPVGQPVQLDDPFIAPLAAAAAA